MKKLMTCIFLLVFGASCVEDMSNEASAELHAEADALTIFLTGNELGALKPCGCSGGQLGGLDRRTTVFNSVPANKRLIVDTGLLVKSQSEQDLIKFNIILQALKILDYDLIRLSEQDIEIGANTGFVDGVGSVISSHNLPDANLPAMFTKELLLEGQTVVITIAVFDAKSSPVEQIEQLFVSESGSQRVNILILNHCDDSIMDFISESIPVVDCVICPAEADEPVVVNQTNRRPLVFSVGRFGRYIAGLRITQTRGSEDNRRLLGTVNTSDGKLRLSFFAIPLVEDLKQDALLVQLYKDYQELVKQAGLLDKYPRVPLPNDLKYTGSKFCKPCHEPEYEAWSSKPHAQAYETLEKVGSQFDPECVVCHVIGLKYESGFTSIEQTEHLKDVGCENCHGPGLEHIRSAGVVKMPEPKSACIECHTPEHSGDYAGNENLFLEKIRHWAEPQAAGSVK